MLIQDLLSELKNNQVDVEVINDQLKVTFAQGTQSPEIIDKIKAHKKVLIDFLQANSYITIPKQTDRDHYALSQAQKRLWMFTQRNKNSAAYNVASAYRLAGTMRVEALNVALNNVVARHESLRTVFVSVDGEPRQRVISPESAITAVEIVDLSQNGNKENEARIAVEQFAASPFDLSAGPLFKTRLIRLSQTEHVLCFCIHHIISDGWSLDLLISEIGLAYTAAVNGVSETQPGLNIQYRDFSAWQNSMLDVGPQFNIDKKFWSEKFQSLPERLRLPVDEQRPAEKNYLGARYDLELTDSMFANLKSDVQTGASTFMTLLSSVATLMHAYTGQREIVIGSPVAGREHPDVHHQIGFFVNMLPLKIQVDPQQTCSGLLAKTKSVVLEAIQHSQYPFDRIVEDLRLPRETDHGFPLFDVVVVLQNGEASKGMNNLLTGLRIESYATGFTTCLSDLRFVFNEYADRFSLTIEYDKNIFSARTIEQLANYYKTILREQYENGNQDKTISNVVRSVTSLNSSAGNKKWQQNHPASVWKLFSNRVQDQPDAYVLKSEHGSLTYHELFLHAERLAQRLSYAMANTCNKTVAVLADRAGYGYVVTYLAVMRIGGTYVPLDQASTFGVIQYSVKHSEAAFIVTESAFVSSLQLLDASVILLGDESTNAETAAPGATTDYAQGSHILFSSQSTQPKPIRIEEANVSAIAQDLVSLMGLRKDEVFFQNATSSVMAINTMAVTFAAGGCLTLSGEKEPSEMERAMEKASVTAVMLPSVIASGIVRWPASMRVVATYDDRVDLFRPISTNHNIAVYDMYLPSAFGNIAGISGRRSPNSGGGLDIVGNIKVTITDDYAGDLPRGARGLITITELKSADSSKAIGTYQTGHLGKVDESGKLYPMGLKNAVLETGSTTVDLNRISGAITRNSDILQAVPLAQQDTLMIFVQLTPTATLSAEQLRSYFAAGILLEASRIQIRIVELFPTTEHGDVDLKKLMKEHHTESSGVIAIAPSSETEVKLAEMWLEILGVPVKSITDNFFDLGGQSLKAMKLLSKIHQQYQIDVDLEYFFSNPTIDSLSKLISKN